MTIRDQIIGTIVAALNTNRPPGIPEARRGHLSPVDGEDKLPAIFVRPFRETVRPLNGTRWAPIVDRELTVTVDAYATGQPVDSELDKLYEWIAKTVVGSLGAVANDTVETQSTWAFADSSSQLGRLSIDFSVWFNTARNDPSKK